MRTFTSLFIVGAYGSSPAISYCQEHMKVRANPIYVGHCVNRCELYGGSFGVSYCGPDVVTNGIATVQCVYKMEGAACANPNDDSATTTSYPAMPATSTVPGSTYTTRQPVCHTTTQTPKPTTIAEAATTTVSSTTTTVATTSKATTTVPPKTTTTTMATTSESATTVPPTTTVAPDAPSTSPSPTRPPTHIVGEPGFWSPNDASVAPVTGATGPNGECVWGYNQDQNRQGAYAGVSNKVYQALQWVDSTQQPGSSSLWKYVSECKGTAPESYTVEQMNKLVKTPSEATIFYDPWTPALPSLREIAETEDNLSRDPLVKELIDAVRVLDHQSVEAITPGNPSNPENVKRVENFLHSETWEKLFPFRHQAYSYENFLKAVGAFPNYCRTYSDGRNSDAICKKLVAASFAHYSQETGANAPAWTITRNDCPPENRNEEAKKYFDPNTPIPTYLQGLYWIRETAYSGPNAEAIATSGYEKCDPTVDQPWSICFPCSDKHTYYGRGSKQLSWNYNYGLFSKAMYGDAKKLLEEPSLVAETWLNFASGIWFAVTPQSPKPPMTWALDGTWTKNAIDDANGLSPGFGATIEIINGGYECRSGSTSPQAANRILAYKNFMKLFGLEIPADEPNDCAGSKGFPTNSPVSTLLYWAKDWSKPGACKRSAMQTPFTVVNVGDYGRCVDFYWRSHVIYKGKEIIKNGETVFAM